MKAACFVALPLLACVACAGGPASRAAPRAAPSPLLERAARPTLFRVEMRRHEFLHESSKSARLRAGGGPELRGQSLQSRVRQTAFVVGRLEDEMLVVVSPDSFRVRLGALGPAGVEAWIAQESRPLEGGGRASSLRTRVIVPLGSWMPVGGVKARGQNRASEVEGFPPGAGVGASAQRRDSGYEIRVSAAR